MPVKTDTKNKSEIFLAGAIHIYTHNYDDRIFLPFWYLIYKLKVTKKKDIYLIPSNFSRCIIYYINI
jgi:hypothetical protein